MTVSGFIFIFLVYYIYCSYKIVYFSVFAITLVTTKQRVIKKKNFLLEHFKQIYFLFFS